MVPHDFVDTASVMLRFGTGATGTLTAIGAAPNFNRLHFYGENGWAEVRGTNRLEFQPLGGELVVEEFEPVDMLRAQLEAFAAAAQGKADWPVPPADGLNVVKSLVAILDSFRANGERKDV